MPVSVNQMIQDAIQEQIINAKQGKLSVKTTFSKDLTGNHGASTGILSKKNAIGNAKALTKYGPYFMSRTDVHDEKTTTKYIALTPVDHSYAGVADYEAAHATDIFTDTQTGKVWSVTLIPETVIVMKTTNSKAMINANTTQQGSAVAAAAALPSNVTFNTNQTTGIITEKVVSVVYAAFLYADGKCVYLNDQICDRADIEYDFKQTFNAQGGIDEDGFMDRLYTFIDTYDLYDETEYMADELLHINDLILAMHGQHSLSSTRMKEIVKNMESFPVSMDIYTDMYVFINKEFPNDVEGICKQNINLSTQVVLAFVKAQYDAGRLANPIPNPNPSLIGKPYSRQQKEAICDESPLAMAQSVAGSGKSTVIKARIGYMEQCGINPSDIIALSFTNAAADHLSKICPGVKSMTIATMVNSIYSVNFKNQSLAETHTFNNACTIYMRQLQNTSHSSQAEADFAARMKDFIPVLKRYLTDVDKGEMPSFTNLLNLVRDNLSDVIKICDAVHMTTLTLQLVIADANIAQMAIPDTVMAHHIIVDEVQDNSMFEFVYLLTYTGLIGASLFMVGDCSQTLYEFRMANPTALNMLEASNVFTTHALETNYRSNGEVIALANPVLGTLATNNIAQLKLRANSLASVTPKSFKDKVKYTMNVYTGKKVEDYIPLIMTSDVEKYIREAYDRGESVAVIGATRRIVNAALDYTQKIYPDMPCISILPIVPKPLSYFSDYITGSWNDTKVMNPQTMMHDIETSILSKYGPVGSTDARYMRVKRFIDKFHSLLWGSVQNVQLMYASNTLNADQVREQIKKIMLDYENMANQDAQRFASMHNEEMKKNAKDTGSGVIFSTIHSVKGLEFDNVVVLYDPSKERDESTKRMYYVALTRAKNTEFVVEFTRHNDISIMHSTYDTLSGANLVGMSADADIATA